MERTGSVKEIEEAVLKLSVTELDAEAWDRQIEDDVAAGRLDALADEALGSASGPLHGTVKHSANLRFWNCYGELPDRIRRPRRDPKHPSLHFKKVGRFWSVRVGLHYRALAVEHENTVVWFWIGPHAPYTTA